MVEDLKAGETVVVADPPVAVVTPPVVDPAAVVDPPASDPIADAKVEVEKARAEAAAAQAERDAANAERDAARADAEIARRSLANPVPATPVKPAELTDEQKQQLAEDHGYPSYDVLVKNVQLMERIVSRGTAASTRDKLVSAMREKYGATFINHEAEFRAQLNTLSPEVQVTEDQAEGIFNYVYGAAALKGVKATPSAVPAARPAGAGRQIVGGTGLEGTQGGAPSPAPATNTKLTDDEKLAAKLTGVSEADYAESKKKNAVYA